MTIYRKPLHQADLADALYRGRVEMFSPRKGWIVCRPIGDSPVDSQGRVKAYMEGEVKVTIKATDPTYPHIRIAVGGRARK